VSKVCLRAFDTAMQIQLLERDGVEVCRDCAAEHKP